MMTKKDFKEFADALSECTDEVTREHLIERLCPIFRHINSRFSEVRFREWIKRRINGESMVGLR